MLTICLVVQLLRDRQSFLSDYHCSWILDVTQPIAESAQSGEQYLELSLGTRHFDSHFKLPLPNRGTVSENKSLSDQTAVGRLIWILVGGFSRQTNCGVVGFDGSRIECLCQAKRLTRCCLDARRQDRRAVDGSACNSVLAADERNHPVAIAAALKFSLPI